MKPMDCGNAAFDEAPASEIARILRHVAKAVERGDERGQLVDVNGNTVGSWRVEE
jgi:hypothetical protein